MKPPSIRVKQCAKVRFPDNSELNDYTMSIVGVGTACEIRPDTEDVMLVLHDQRKLVVYHLYQKA